MPNKGILVGADEKIEWLLPWWWAKYSAHNAFPVAFVDFGLSYFGKTFCKERGLLIDLPLNPQFGEASKNWETLFGKNFSASRSGWYKKPFACLETPFETTLWLDLDCEVLQPLDSLLDREGEVYLAQETDAGILRNRGLGVIAEDEILYNSGVILFQRYASFIQKWADAVLAEGEEFCSDQHSLSHLIYRENTHPYRLEDKYNWRMSQGLNLDAAIVHWAGSWGKDYIRRYGGIAEELVSLLY